MSKQWAHDELAADLAAHLRGPDRMIWLDMQLGPAGSPRPDVYAIDKSFVSPFPTAYECKISTADFRSDVTSGKWSSYLKYAYRVFFAAPAGMVTKADVPDMCGLIVRHENAWRLAKKPVVNPVTIPQAALLKLLIDGVQREGPKIRAKAWHNEGGINKFSKKFGSTAARYVCDATNIQNELASAEAQRLSTHEKARKEAAAIIQRAREDLPVRWIELLDVLGIPHESTRYDVEREIRELRNSKEGTEEARQFRNVLAMMRRILNQNERFEKLPVATRNMGPQQEI